MFEASLQSKSDIIQHKKWHQIETPFEILTTLHDKKLRKSSSGLNFLVRNQQAHMAQAADHLTSSLQTTSYSPQSTPDLLFDVSARGQQAAHSLLGLVLTKHR